jgi:cobalt-zinc-cadmium efflux system outer membrane protein
MQVSIYAQSEQVTSVNQPVSLDNYPTPIYNQYTDSNNGINLETFIDKAKSSNKELQVARQNLAIIQGRIIQAGLKPNPTLDVEFTSDKLGGTREGEYDFSASYIQPLERGGKRAKRTRIAQLELAQAEKELTFQEQQIISDVRLQYAESIAALESLKVTERLIALNENTTKLVEVKVKEGDAARLDLNLVIVEVNRLKASRLQAEIRVRSAITKLKALASIGLQEVIRLQPTLNLTTPENLNLESLQEMALHTRADLQAVRIGEDLAQARIDLAQAETKPDINVFGRYRQSKSIFDKTAIGKLEDTDRQIGFGVSIPLPLFNRNQGAIAEATATKVQASHRVELAEQVVKQDVALAYAKLEIALDSLKLYEKELLPGTQENLKIIRAAYDLGDQPLLDVISEQRRLIESQQQYTDVRKDYYLSIIELEKALGLPVQ